MTTVTTNLAPLALPTFTILLLLLLEMSGLYSCYHTVAGHFTKFIHKTVVQLNADQTSADGLNGQRQVGCITDEKDESPFAMSQVRSRPASLYNSKI